MIIEDSELGNIILKPNARARTIICRYRDGQFQLTFPSHLSKAEIMKTIESMRQDMHRLKENHPESDILLQNGSEREMYQSKIKISEGSLRNFYYGYRDGVHNIVCPPGTDYSTMETKTILKKHIVNILRKSAMEALPPKAEHYASIHGFSYQQVKINTSRGRWGSCSSRQTINLSCFCMLFPEYLIDFVILHELCHTIEMNHGVKFWQLLDSVTQNNAKRLTKELALQSKKVYLNRL